MEAPGESRYITTDQTVQGLGLNILGGNATGIFVCDVKSPGYDLGIRVGDQLLEVGFFHNFFFPETGYALPEQTWERTERRLDGASMKNKRYLYHGRFLGTFVLVFFSLMDLTSPRSHWKKRRWNCVSPRKRLI